MRIATTASPVSGADVRERMEELRLMLKIERSVQVICRTWKKWKMEKKDDLLPDLALMKFEGGSDLG